VGARKHGNGVRGASYGASGRDEGRGGIEATARCSGTAAGGVGRGPAGRHRALGLKDAPRVLSGPPNNHRFGERRGSVGFPPAGRSLAGRLADSSEDGRKIVRLTTLSGPPAKSRLRGACYGAYVREATLPTGGCQKGRRVYGGRRTHENRKTRRLALPQSSRFGARR
jgi:hypothetical protein